MSTSKPVERAPRKDMLTEQMLTRSSDANRPIIRIQQRVRVDLSGLSTDAAGVPIEAWVQGVVLDNDTFHQLVTIKLDNNVFTPEVAIRVPAERVQQIQ